MAYDKSSLDNYVDVATRIAEFRARYPAGYLAPLSEAEPFRVVEVSGGIDQNGEIIKRTFVVVVAAAYREPGDTCPGVGMAWEPFPGRTPYTRDSELMNAETSAWGRAIIAVGAADSRAGIASREEVRNRQAERDGVPVNADGSVARSKLTEEQRREAGIMTNAQTREHGQLRKLDHPRNAERVSGPLPDDQWQSDVPNGDQPGTSTLRQQQDIAMRLSAKGVTTREEKLAFCSAVAGREIASSKELSFTEAVDALRRTGELPAVTG